MTKLLIGLYHFFQKRKVLFYIVSALLFGVLTALALRIHIEEDISHAMPNGKQVEKITKIFQHSSFADKLVIRINAADSNATPENLIAYAAATDSALQAGYGKYITSVKSKIDDDVAISLYNNVHENLPLYLTDADYLRIDTMITHEHVRDKLESDYKVLSSATGLVMKKLIADDPIGINTIALGKLNDLQINNDFDLYDGYIFTKDHRSVLLFVTPSNPSNETAKNSVLVNGIGDFFRKYEAGTKLVKAYCYGGTAVAVGNAKQMKQDTIVTLTITLVSLLLFLWFFFRRKRIPFIMMLPVVFGALFAIVIIGLFKGSISNIALAAGSIVLGIAINYSLHFFGHYKHCGSIEETISDLVMPLTLGSFTTVGSFLSLLFVKSQILNDFGLFAGLSLMGAAAFTLVFLPHFLPKAKDSHHDEPGWLDKLITSDFKYQGALVVVIIALTIFFGYHVRDVSFMSDMMSLSYQTDELKAAEKQINALQGDSSKTVFIASTGNSIDEALANSEKLSNILSESKRKGIIKRYSSLGDVILSQEKQQERIAKWNSYWTAEKKQQLLSELKTEGAAHKFRPQAFDHFANTLNKEYAPIGMEGFEDLKNAFGSDLIIDSKEMKAVISSVNINRKDRAKLYAEIEKDPSVVILDKETVTHKFIEIIYSDFNDILLYTSLLVFFALLLSYGRIELTIITFLPMFITWIWILGIMGLCGIQFNIINIIISTFIFGLGDDFAIFITDGLTDKFKRGKDTLSSHKVSIFLGAATTIIGLGALIFAKHPALRSIALVSIIGIVCVLVIGQTIQPFIYNYYIQRRKEQGLPPYTIFYFIITFIEYTYFFVASIIMTVIGFILIKALPFPNIKTRKYWFHWLICQYMKSLVYIPVHVKKVHIGKEQMDFSKPAIIIANHTSFLDILVTVMQHPKIILLTNEWTYHSPIFGKVIQLADYYPTADGTDESAIQRLKDKVADGYSIVVFPEGTRSIDGVMKRFHK
ncbi:MAG: methyltransferase protein [Bacteroidetes bacterium]|nr:methyltransferase protein [Bacteroidota bacterium]